MPWIVFLLWLGCSGGASAAAINDLRVWHAPDQTRLVFDLSEAVHYEVFAVRNPDRLVVDFKGSATSRPLILPVFENPRVTKVRYAPSGNDKFRVVFDLAHPVEVRKAMLAPHAPYGERLVVDLLDPKSTSVTAHKSTLAPTTPSQISSTATASIATEVKASDKTPAIETRDADSETPAAPVAVTRTQPKFVIAIDAGHGGEDVGAIGQNGTYEKNVVLAIAQELAALINAEPNMRAAMMRDGDYYVGLRDRIERARDQKADMFISVHADAFRDQRVRGSSVYVLSLHGATTEAGRWLAEQENASDLVGGVTLDDKDQVVRSVLLDLSQNASMEASQDIARNVLHALHQVGELHHPDIQSAGFVVLKSPDIPSLLVETAFITNPIEEQHLNSPEFRHNIAAAIRDGVKAYYARNRVTPLRSADNREHRVQPGDTLSGIAERYAVSPKEILVANSRTDRAVRLGEVLRIP